jgi:hypothetical protein
MDRRDLTAGMKFVFFALLIGVCIAIFFETCGLKPAYAEPAEPAEPNTGQSRPLGAVAYLLERDHTPAKDPRWKESERFEVALYGAAVDNGLDPALFIAMAYKESSFDTSARGRLGEFGLVQVHGKAKRGCDLTTAEGQAACGARWLARVVQECGGSLVLDPEKCRNTGARGACSGGLAGYASGSCSARTVRTAQLIRGRLRLAEKIRPFLLDETQVLVNRIF